eukprot:42457-Pyramimonas_sp.AAC.1
MWLAACFQKDHHLRPRLREIQQEHKIEPFVLLLLYDFHPSIIHGRPESDENVLLIHGVAAYWGTAIIMTTNRGRL